jgi:uncharacterized delta-60 repeat protein
MRHNTYQKQSYYDKNIMRKIYLSLIITVASLHLYGQVDTTFGNNGRAITSFSKDCRPAKMVILKDNKILTLVKVQEEWNIWTSYLMRYNEDGSLDQDFGINGILKLEQAMAVDMAVTEDEKIFIYGYFNGSICLYRLNKDGTYDNTFGTNGFVFYNELNIYDDHPSAIALLKSGKILTTYYEFYSSGDACFDGNASTILKQLLPDGSLDVSFGYNGHISYTNEPYNNYSSYHLSIGEDEKIYLSAYHTLIRLLSNGSLDMGFGNGGKISGFINNSDFPIFLTIQKDKKVILAVGWDYLYPACFKVTRIHTDGTLDEGFGLNGVQYIFNSDSSYSQAAALAIGEDGKIIVGGFIRKNISSDSDFAIARLLSDGSVDTTFGTDGKIIIDVNMGRDDHIYDIALKDDGKILLYGNTQGFAAANIALLRIFGVKPVFETPDTLFHINTPLLFPNPAFDETSLTYSLEKEGDISIYLIDLQGNILVTYLKDTHQSIGFHKERILLQPTLPKGFYGVVISDSEGNRTCNKLIKN